MRATFVGIAVLFTAAPAFAQLPKKLPAAVPLWPKGAPGSEARAAEAEEVVGSNVGNVHNPTLTPYLPDAAKATGTAVIICPGGGHSKLCLGHEGYALAEWFRDRGIAAFVLKYRLAREKGSTYTVQGHAMADTRRAIRLVRSRAGEWHLKKDRIGILGFSAGGELAAYAAMKSDPGTDDAADPVERQSSRPDFQALIYPGSTGTLEVERGMPPAFLAAGYGDRPDISEGLATLYLKYKAAKVPAELHLFANAGHGFGYRHDAKPSAAARWPERFTEWLGDSGLLPPEAAVLPLTEVKRDIPYVEKGHARQVLDVYSPKKAKNLPVVFWIHGGGWQAGDKSDVQIKPRVFAARGFVFVSTNYRLLPGVDMATIVRDIAKSVRWVHDHIAEYGGDPNRLLIMGHSAGAQLAALVCTDERYLKAEGLSLAIVKGCVPVDGDTFDVPAIIETAEARWKAHGLPRAKFGHREKFGNDPAKHRDFSAVTHAAKDKGIPPFLILHVADHPDTSAQARRLGDALKEAGVPVTVFGGRETTHNKLNADIGSAGDPATRALFEFLDKALKK